MIYSINKSMKINYYNLNIIIIYMMEYILYTLIGALSGISMGTIGIGAGIITIPLLILTGMDMNTAVGCVLLMQLLPQSLPGVIVYHREEYIHYESAFVVILGSILGIFIGSLLISYKVLTEEMCYKIITLVLIITTIMFIKQHFMKK